MGSARQGLISLLVITAAFSSGCNSYVPKERSTPDAKAESGSQPGYTVPTYAYVRAQVFQPYCVSCHSDSGGNPHGVNLETYGRTLENIKSVSNEALVEKSMPPSHPIPDYAQSLLRIWIDGGAPQDGVLETPGAAPSASASPTPPAMPQATPAPTPTSIDVLKPTWSSISTNILQARCVSCHGGSKPAHRIDLSSLDSVVKASNGLVVPGSPNSSLLIKAITGQGEKLMPPRGSALSSAEIDAIEMWILNGARD